MVYLIYPFYVSFTTHLRGCAHLWKDIQTYSRPESVLRDESVNILRVCGFYISDQTTEKLYPEGII